MSPEEEDYRLLSIFADGKPHDWWSTIYIGVHSLKIRQSRFERLLQRAAEYGWIYRVGLAAVLQDDQLQLGRKGDLYFRDMAIRRTGDFRYYKYFNREEQSQGFSEFGLDKFAPLPKNLQKIDTNPNGTPG